MGRKEDIRISKFKNTSVLLACVLLSCMFFCRVYADVGTVNPEDNSLLQIYLPREVAVKGSDIKLGRVSVIRGEDALVSKAGETALGRISIPGQKIVIDRPLLLSRLVCSGIPASKVQLSGAENITVKRQEQIIKGSDFIEPAITFLKGKLPADSVCQMDPVQIPDDLIIPKENEDIKFTPLLVGSTSSNVAKVRIVVSQFGRQIGSREITFRLKYNRRKAVTTVNIQAGTIINPENTKIENTISNYPESVEWKPPYGLVARRKLPANTVLRPSMLSQPRSEVIIKRNQNVVIRVDKPELMVTAVGKALQEARGGEYIKVRNIDSQRIILARVNEDGTVEPIF
jgi:flagella basal body P-ring formation protein FlgA